MKDQPSGTIDDIIAEIKGMTIEEIVASETWEGPHLITRDVLLAAGALDVPPAWRKSLSAGCAVERDLFSDLADEEDSADQAQADSAQSDSENDEA